MLFAMAIRDFYKFNTFTYIFSNIFLPRIWFVKVILKIAIIQGEFYLIFLVV